MKKIIHLICAARPNFMKVAPLFHQLQQTEWLPEIIHTGQHYDYKMSKIFFENLALPEPHHYLNIGSGSHAQQTAAVMVAYEKLCIEKKPDLVVVVGDVNSTMASAITAKKCHLKLAHLEAGLRSFDRSMPEELNRVLTDAISDILWTPSVDADENLKKEGIVENKIHRVGNIMMDAYKMMEGKIQQSTIRKHLNLQPQQYGVITLHRPSNVDDLETLSKILKQMEKLDFPCVFPVHPRTREKMLALLGGLDKIGNIILIEPLSYIDFMRLLGEAKLVLTDSGGIQEETTYLGIPCYTLRETTERPITISLGSNQLVNLDNFMTKIQNLKKGIVPELWDGKTAERIVQSLKNYL